MAVSGISKISDFPAIGSLADLESSDSFVLRPIDNEFVYVGGDVNVFDRYEKKKTGLPPLVELKKASSWLIQHIEDLHPHKFTDQDVTTDFWYAFKKGVDGLLYLELLTDAEKTDFSYDNSQEIIDFEVVLGLHKNESAPSHKLYDDNDSLEKGYSLFKDGDFMRVDIVDTYTYETREGELEEQQYDYGYMMDVVKNHQEETENRHTINNISTDEKFVSFSKSGGFLIMTIQEETFI